LGKIGNKVAIFTEEEESRYRHMYDEGQDISEDRYEEWVKANGLKWPPNNSTLFCTQVCTTSLKTTFVSLQDLSTPLSQHNMEKSTIPHS
jgi:hypothetical protein